MCPSLHNCALRRLPMQSAALQSCVGDRRKRLARRRCLMMTQIATFKQTWGSLQMFSVCLRRAVCVPAHRRRLPMYSWLLISAQSKIHVAIGVLTMHVHSVRPDIMWPSVLPLLSSSVSQRNMQNWIYDSTTQSHVNNVTRCGWFCVGFYAASCTLCSASSSCNLKCTKLCPIFSCRFVL